MPRLQGNGFVALGTEISFEMDGVPCRAIEGETIAAALIASGHRSFKRGRHGERRGLSCGMGACFECEVSIDGAAPERACMTKVHAGMRVASTSYRKPLPNIHAAAESPSRECIHADVLVIGGGPAGMTAAVELDGAGVSVVLADERADPGGQFYKQPAASQDYAAGRPPDSQYAEGRALIERLRASGTRLLTGATVWGAFRGDGDSFETGIRSPGESYLLETRAILVATGAFEPIPAFPGWTLPGVMSTGAAQALARAYRVSPGERVVVAGNGPLNFQLACELLSGGVQVLAVAEAAPLSALRRLRHGLPLFAADARLAVRGLQYLSTLRRHGIPVLYGQHVARAEGSEELEAVVLAPLGADGRSDDTSERRFNSDALCVGYGLQPSNELARALGCTFNAVAPGLTRPLRSDRFETDVPGVFVVGDGAALGGAQVALAEARIAAAELAARFKPHSHRNDSEPRRHLERHRRFQRHLWSLFAAPASPPPDDGTLICRCESVTTESVRRLVASGVVDMGALKRSSRAGMGSCQGRYCQRHLASLIAHVTGDMPAAAQLFEARLPAKPTAIGTLVDEKPDWVGYRVLDRELEPLTCEDPPPTPRGSADVLVIGAGIIGLSTARALARRGVDVLVVDRALPMSQASGTNAGSLHGQLLSSDFDLVDGSVSPAGCTLTLQRMGIEAWRALENELGADFELQVTGGVVVAASDEEMAFVERKAAFEQAHGLEVELWGASQLRERLLAVSSRMRGAVYCAGEGKINPLAAGPAVLSSARNAGVRLETPSAVLSIARHRGSFEVRTTTGVIKCARIVNAAGGWAAGVAKLVGTSLPVLTAPQQMIVTEPVEPAVPLLVAAAGRHLTLKQVANGNLIIGGGWPAKFHRERGRATSLRESIEGNLWVAQQVIPALAGVRMLRSWATVGVMIDGAPILGEDPGCPGFFNCVGANGYTMGPVLGAITAGLLAGEEAPLDVQPLSMARFG